MSGCTGGRISETSEGLEILWAPCCCALDVYSRPIGHLGWLPIMKISPKPANILDAIEHYRPSVISQSKEKFSL